ncbi:MULTISPECIES: hypothetical protein [unclassified Microbulbifer]|uniref:hypothetical protein n=1 Tax=unclassified Microbulbifer TaxID=2619833 RepID=UPI0027E4DD0B|nr:MULTISPECIES: hypothetical protein [unclassified Microbulbifer]
MRSVIHGLFIALFTLVLAGCTSHSVMNINDSPVPNRLNGVPQTAETVRQGILAGCVDKGWNCREISPGLIEASIKVRNHRATTEISYNKNSYNILYKNSSMLDYNERNNTIHRNYNRWISYLDNAIHKRLAL